MALALLAGAAAAPAAQYPTGWNGDNPFDCVLQQAGFGAVGPDPAADPYCIEFDKRRQNITELGIVDFLAQEPARVAAATDKCFYFQADHWRGSVVQADASTKTYEYDGAYFFDKAKGEGGAHVTNFSLNGRTYDPSAIPGVPTEYARYFGPGTGGFITRNDFQADPACIAKARAKSPYAKPKPGAGPARGCVAARGTFTGRGIGGVNLGDAEGRVRGMLGEPNLVRRGFLRWCHFDGTSIRVGQAGDRSGERGAGDDPTVFLLATNRAYRTRGIGPGSSPAAFRRAFPRTVLRLRIGRTAVFSPGARSGLLVALRSGRVHWVALYDTRAVRTRAALRSFLFRAG